MEHCLSVVDATHEFDAEYEFDAPRFCDFLEDETVEDKGRAERWFEEKQMMKEDSKHQLAARRTPVLESRRPLKQFKTRPRKVSACSLTKQGNKNVPRNATPNPFHLRTEERGAEKKKRMVEELTRIQLEEERARVPKARLYPCTTDYPMIPPKPKPKSCTKPEPFQLKSLAKKEEEMQREVEKRRRMEIDKAHMRILRAKPILQEKPIPEKMRMLLIENQELNVDNRAVVDRAEFDKKVKSTNEIEKVEPQNDQQINAGSLSRKIPKGKVGMRIFRKRKQQLVVPQICNFTADNRIPHPPAADTNEFDMAKKEKKPLGRSTTPGPLHLHTEERGAEKEKRMVEELKQKQLEEERARIPKARPYPYTTDYPMIPPKPWTKPCTQPEPFQLRSLLRHEEEMRREIEKRRRTEIEEARMRIFWAKPIPREDPIPIPEKIRKPLTEVQEFNLHVDHRVVDREEFEKKIKEKELAYKRYREELESTKMMKEAKALKQLRRTLIHHARPMPNFDRPFLRHKRSSKQVGKFKNCK